MWYPSRSRTNELSAELAELEAISAHQARNLDEYLPVISTALRGMSEIEGYPRYQIRDWIWVASQFRLYASNDPEVVRLAGSALNFVGKLLDTEVSISEHAVRDLNWILDCTVAEISANLGPSSIRSFLSPEEIEKIGIKLAELVPVGKIDLSELRAEVAPHLESFKTFSSRAYLPSLLDKIESLFRAASSTDDKAKAAIAALRYLAKPDDVVPDRLNYLGLLDDIHVIEQAYAVVEGHTLWLPVLEKLLEEWPFLDNVVLDTGEKRIKPGLYLSFVMGACLDGLFRWDDNAVIIIPEPGPSALLAAFLASIATLRIQNKTREE